ncbi:MAG: urate oxidase [Chloroflexota bacterium]|nr:urate oxidase [Chloroflexota bacterium]
MSTPTSRLPPPASRLTMREIESLEREAFVARIGALFEGSPWIAAESWDSRPWGNREALHAAMTEVVACASQDRQLALIRAHPDLVGDAALASSLTRESTAEQRAAGLDPATLSAAEIIHFTEANAAYQQKFDFPFVICARENSKDAIIAGLARRLGNDRRTEIATALREIEQIAWNRLADLVQDDPASPEAAATPAPLRYEVSYGKQGVPVYRVFATPLHNVPAIPESSFTGRDNTLLACEISVEVFGDEFLPAYTHGDNTMLVATDSMKNFIIRETLAYPGATMDGLLHFLGLGFANTYLQMHTLTLTAREIPFAPAIVPTGDGGHRPGDNLFRHGRGDRAFASLSIAKRDAAVAITGHDCGITGIELMKLTGSAFTSFLRDGYTTLPERGDRPLYIEMDVAWQYTNVDDMIDLTRNRYVPVEQMRDLLAATFDDFVSESIQHLLHEMGQRVLARFPQLAELRFDALNRTRDPYGQRDDDPRVRIYSDPFPAYGRLTLTMRRGV